MTKCHQMGRLKQQKFMVSSFWRLEVQDPGINKENLSIHTHTHTHTHTEEHVKMKAEIRVMLLQAKECQILAANHRKLERRGTLRRH